MKTDAAAANPPRPLSPRVRSALIAGALVVVAITGLLIYALATGPRGPAPRQEAGALPATRADSYVLDDAGPGAPTLVEFMDFECEACGAFYPVVEQIREQYAGQINYVIRYFPIASHANAMNAALAVEAAAQQGQVEDMYHRMFQTQAEWGEQQTSQADLFRSFAEELGLDLAAYDDAVADPATQERVQQDLDDGQALGVQGTPTFFLDGQRLELSSVSDLTDALDRALDESGGA
ncbi:thioredoxin domain-containing protein [Cellulomonas sp. Y8]|uniref:DsbA family protein n=1 Tax=Cellulomonas sp. Y8 TaxID=2591145 RepID=UPI0011C7E0A6|nr:thioredoxin domain-containing protein [Cellulomonas sp. Y8]